MPTMVYEVMMRLRSVVLNLVGGTEPTSSIHAFIEPVVVGKIKCVS